MALAGRYLSPVAFGPCVDGLPLLVLHSCFVHAFRLCCGFFKLDISLPLPNLSKVLGCLQDPFKYITVSGPVISRKLNPDSHRQPSYTAELAFVLFSRTIALENRLFR